MDSKTMIEVKFMNGTLSSDEQQIITAGFDKHSDQWKAPNFKKERINWVIYDSQGDLIGALIADVFWNWIYIDELWISESYRGKGLGQTLMSKAEDYAISHELIGLYLWTQSWQAENFYKHLGYEEFTRFPDFPIGFSRIGFRKQFSSVNAGN
jgi:ribosomal protein S18 acetylase RimI-like enzyme